MKGRILNRRILNRRDFVCTAASAGGLALGALPICVLAQPVSSAKRPVSIVNAGGNIALAFEEMIKRLGYLDELGLEARTINVSDSSKIIRAATPISA